MKLELIKHYKNYTSLKRELFQRVGIYSNKTIKIRCYTSIEDNLLATDLEVEIFSQEDIFIDSLTIASVETKNVEDFYQVTEKQRQLLLPEKQKVFNYLNEVLPNVLCLEDFVL